MDPYIHSPISLCGVLLNLLKTGATLTFEDETAYCFVHSGPDISLWDTDTMSVSKRFFCILYD
jgi:hypothetical protein